MTTLGIDSFRDGVSSKFFKIVDTRFTVGKRRQRSSRQKRWQAAFNQESNNINTRGITNTVLLMLGSADQTGDNR